MTYNIIIRSDSAHIQSDEGLITLDADGRFRQWYDRQRLIKRGLNHDFLLKEIIRENGGKRTINRRRLSEIEVQSWTEQFEQLIGNALFDENTNWTFNVPMLTAKQLEVKQTFIEQAQRWTFSKLQEQGKQFSQLYKPISILPPDQYQAIMLQISEGCSYNKCTFCNFYRDRPFRIKGLEETRNHIKKVKAFFGEDIYRRKTIFLGDANAIIIPQKRLLQLLDIIEDEFNFEPERGKNIEGLYAFMDVFGLQYKSVDELIELRKHHVKTIYIGLETGDDPLRQFIGKQGVADEVRQQIDHVKAAGIHVGVIIMVGVGGTFYRDSHRKKTVELIQNLHLDNQDMIYLSPFVAHKDLPYVEDMNRQGYKVMTNEDIEQEMTLFKRLLGGITNANISNYFIEEFIY